MWTKEVIAEVFYNVKKWSRQKSSSKNLSNENKLSTQSLGPKLTANKMAQTRNNLKLKKGHAFQDFQNFQNKSHPTTQSYTSQVQAVLCLRCFLRLWKNNCVSRKLCKQKSDLVLNGQLRVPK